MTERRIRRVVGCTTPGHAGKQTATAVLLRSSSDLPPTCLPRECPHLPGREGQILSMTDGRPTWSLVFEAATQLSEHGPSPFKLSELIAQVQLRDPGRGRGTISPVVQGMTANAGKGPLSPCGKVLLRVEHGYYKLQVASSEAEPAPGGMQPPKPRLRPRRGRTLGHSELQARLVALIADFDHCVEVYDSSVPFTRTGQYEFHRRTIERRRALGSAEAACYDDQFTDLLHSTLQKWGIGRRRSLLAPLEEFRSRLQERVPEIHNLELLALEHPNLDVPGTSAAVDRLVSELHVVDNRARIVAGTKTLHHLLPDLVPPMDRAWTGAFFGWSVLDPQNNQSGIMAEAFTALAEVARATQPSRLVGPGWRTSATKVLDNALIGYCKLHGIGGTPS